MKRKVLLSIVFLLSAGFFSDDLLAQEPDTLDLSTDVFEYFRKPGPDGTRLRIAQSDSIRVKVNWQAEQNRLSSQKMQGFRVRIFLTTSRLPGPNQKPLPRPLWLCTRKLRSTGSMKILTSR